MTRKKKIVKEPTKKGEDNLAKAFMQFYGSKKEHTGLRLAVTNTSGWSYVDFIDPYTRQPCLPLEYLFGSRGLLGGRITLLQAKEGVGKSSFIALLFGMGIITSNALCLLLESENAEFPEDRVAELGCDPSRVFHMEIIDLPACLTYINSFTHDVRTIDPEKESPILIGIDSLSSLSEIEMDKSDVALDVDLTKTGQVGKHARMMSEWFRKGTVHYLKDNNVSLIFTGQLKQKINTGYGFQQQKDTTLGGRAIRFHATYILTLKATPYMVNKAEVGTQLQLYTEKNKVAPCHRTITMDLFREGGFKPNSGLLGMLSNAKSGIDGRPLFNITGSGGWYTWKDLTDKKFRSSELPDLLYTPEKLDFLMHVREKLRIRGYGFKFEQLEPEEELNDEKYEEQEQ